MLEPQYHAAANFARQQTALRVGEFDSDWLASQDRQIDPRVRFVTTSSLKRKVIEGAQRNTAQRSAVATIGRPQPGDDPSGVDEFAPDGDIHADRVLQGKRAHGL